MSLLNSHRDDRRRRALAEDAASDTAAVAGNAASLKPAGKAERYTAAARPENHRRVSQLLPSSNIALALWFMAGLTIAAGLLVGHAFMPELAIAENSVVPLLNLAAGNSLGGWFSTMLLALAAAGSVFIYSLRKHKLDDYRGSYRLWLWSAAAWLTMSLDAVANLHAPFSQGLALATGWTLNGNASVWWIGTWGILLSIVALRLVLETRGSPGAVSALGLTLVAWVAAVAIDCCLVVVGPHAVIAAAGCRLLGQLSLLLSIALFARYVQLDVQGLIAVRPAKPKKVKVKKAAATDPETAKTKTISEGKSLKVESSHTASEKRTDLQPHGTSGNNRSTSSFAASKPVTGSFAANRSSRDDDEEDDDDDRSSSYNSSARYDEEDDDEGDDDGDGGNRKLSRAERKRLRKLKKQQER